MNKKLIALLGIIAIAAIGGTIAFFSDTETSENNIFVAGTIDLKVDHTKQIYNNIECKTCDVEVVSDTSNMVISRNGVDFDPAYNAVLVSEPYNTRWTADVNNSNAKWIWATDPTEPEDTYGTTYTFEKTFEWYGPFSGTTLEFAVGSDNSVVVYLNNIEIDRNDGELGYQNPITITNFNPIQGENVLRFEVTNWNQSHDGLANPGGLLYSLVIDGNCEDNFFKENCSLFGMKNLEEKDRFWAFDDIKPGDFGINVISLHVEANDAYVCMSTLNPKDWENDCIEPEVEANDATCDNADPTHGELGSNIKLYAWLETDGDGIYDGNGFLAQNVALKDLADLAIYDSDSTALIAGETKYLGIAWCAGNINWTGTEFVCDGSGMNDTVQSDSFVADLGFYAIQERNNTDFVCSDPR